MVTKAGSTETRYLTEPASLSSTFRIQACQYFVHLFGHVDDGRKRAEWTLLESGDSGLEV